MTIAERIDYAELSANAAFLPWLARAKAIGAKRGQPPLEVARDLGAPAAILDKIEKAGAATLAGQPGLAGSTAAVSAFINSTASGSILTRIIADRIGAVLPLNTYVQVGGGVIEAAIVGEGRPFPVFGLGGQRVLLEAQKIATGIVLSDQLWSAVDARGQAFVADQLRIAVGTVADRLLMANSVDSATLELVATDEIEAREAIRAALNAVSVAGSRIVFGFHPTAASWFATSDLPDRWNPLGGAFLGRPAVVTSGLEAGQVAVFAADKVLASVEAIRIDASADAALEVSEAPTDDVVTPTATTTTSLFQTNSIAVRAILDLAAIPVADSPVALVTVSEGS
jgi:hypothetical protein